MRSPAATGEKTVVLPWSRRTILRYTDVLEFSASLYSLLEDQSCDQRFFVLVREPTLDLLRGSIGVANFSWNMPDDGTEAPAAAPAPSRPALSRRELRDRESVAAAAKTRKSSFSARKANGRTASASSHITASRSVLRRRTSLGKAAPRAVPPRASSRSAPTPAPRRGGQLLRKFITIGAMFGAGALLVATSLPAVALRANPASAATSTVSVASHGAVQSLAINAKAVEPAVARDAYTVVNLMQRSRMKLGLQNFQYTNDVNGTIQWPFPSPVPISSGFGARSSPCGGCSSFHEGVDFIPGAGTPIGAVAAGTVTYAGYDSGFGYHVILDHDINGQKVQTLYAHMIAGSIQVTVGQQVTVTQELGQVGSTGHSTGAHLHLEVHLNGVPVDPFAWLKANAN